MNAAVRLDAAHDSRLILNERIFRTFAKNTTMQIAYNTIINDLFKGELYWVKNTKTADEHPAHESKKYPAEQHWFQFIRSVVLSLCLYGYALVRRGPYDPKTKQHIPECATGRDIILDFDSEKQKWVPRATEFGKVILFV